MSTRRRVALALGLLALALPVAWWLRAGAVGRAFFRGDADVVVPFADHVAANAVAGRTGAPFSTGSPLFDAEWAFVTCQMSVLGLSQVAAARPELAERYAPAVRACLDAMTAPGARAFGTSAWGEDGLVADTANGHAYLGYLALALAVGADLDGRPEVRATADGLVASLAARVAIADLKDLQTYPREVYPPDIASVLGAIGAHGGHPDALAAGLRRFEAQGVDARTGLVYQALSAADGSARDETRGSGSAVAAYFLSFADRALSDRLGAAVESELREEVLGFGAVREYRRGVPGIGDVDSGPVLLGVGVSATGFALATARMRGREDWFVPTYRTAHLFGLPWTVGTRRFLTGGSLGDAILLAMLTATAQ